MLKVSISQGIQPRYATWHDHGSGAHVDFAAYVIPGTPSTISMGLYWSEDSHDWPKTETVPALKNQPSVMCVKNC